MERARWKKHCLGNRIYRKNFNTDEVLYFSPGQVPRGSDLFSQTSYFIDANQNRTILNPNVRETHSGHKGKLAYIN